jgi:probable HAF family extracellular repeat protein
MQSRNLALLAALSLLPALATPAPLISQLHKPEQVRYTVTDLGIVGAPPGQAFAITRNGLVSGASQAQSGVMQAMLWLNKTKFDVGGSYLQGTTNSIAFGGNVWGQAVGVVQTASVDPNGEDFCGFKAFGLPTNGGSCLPFVWQLGKGMTLLPTLGGPNGGLNEINIHGQIAGYAENNKIDSGCPAPQVLQAKPVTWINNKVMELQTVDGDLQGAALAVNDSGQVAGASGACAPFSQQLLLNLQPLHALLWDPGKTKPTDLGNLGGTGHFAGNIALNMNNKGQVVGNSDLTGDTANHAFLWTKEKGMQDLGTLPGDFISAGLNINDRTEIVGVSLDANFNLRAFVWQNGQISALNDLIPASSNLSLILACGINAEGQIVGLAIDKTTGDAHAFLATPKH